MALPCGPPAGSPARGWRTAPSSRPATAVPAEEALAPEVAAAPAAPAEAPPATPGAKPADGAAPAVPADGAAAPAGDAAAAEAPAPPAPAPVPATKLVTRRVVRMSLNTPPAPVLPAPAAAGPAAAASAASAAAPGGGGETLDATQAGIVVSAPGSGPAAGTDPAAGGNGGGNSGPAIVYALKRGDAAVVMADGRPDLDAGILHGSLLATLERLVSSLCVGGRAVGGGGGGL